MSDSTRQALFIGASRGLGLGLVREHLARGWRVVATARGASEGLEKLRDGSDGRLRLERVDIDRPEQIRALHDRLAGERFDLIFVNAGVSGYPEKPITAVTDAEFVQVMTTNALSPVRTAEALEDLLAPGGTLGFMTSILGSVASNTQGGYELYRASKASLNTFVRSMVARQKDAARTVLLLHPGWVRTDMGGPQAPLDVETSTRGLTEVIAARHGRGGLAYVDYQGKDIPW